MLRTSRQYVEVLANGVSKRRISRQYVEVLTSIPVPPIEEAFTDTLRACQYRQQSNHCTRDGG